MKYTDDPTKESLLTKWHSKWGRRKRMKRMATKKARNAQTAKANVQ